jgi:alanine-glyoxylate transaminase/serine-glyoxylate transaminase/serine-pyruvate transaminase
MTQADQAFVPGPRLLLGPGPSEVAPRVLQAMATPLVGHLDPDFLTLMNGIQDQLRRVFRTANPMTFAVSGTGSAGMECCVVNLIEPGDRMVACVNGVFGGRMAEVARRAGAEVTVLEAPWGQTFDLGRIREALKTHRPAALGIVHAETSTGAWQPAEELGALCREFDCLLILDAVTSLGGVPVEVDGWGVDAIYSGTQKCLSCPPGLAPVSFGPRALEKLDRRKTPVRSWYLDVSLLRSYWGNERAYHHTAPISMAYALHEALREVHEEGLEARWQRHALHHRALKAGLAAIGIRYSAQEGRQLPTLNAVHVPEGVDDAAVRKRLWSEFGIEIGGGLGAFKGKVWRIGLMGHSSRAANVLLFLAALERVLSGSAHRFEAGASITAANRVLNDG